MLPPEPKTIDYPRCSHLRPIRITRHRQGDFDSKYGNLYTPLSRHDPEIRLIQLLPGTDEEPIQCDLATYCLGNVPKYEALSYVWGSPEETKSISISGYQHHATTNLYTSFKYLRYPTKARMLWVDAVCINQKDTLEKTRQVEMMGDIYKRCNAALMWLGTGEEIKDSTQMFHMLQELANGNGDWISANQTDARRALLALGKLMISPWWSRTWVVQELLFAPRAFFFLGRQTINWTTLSQAAQFCTSHVSHGSSLLPPGINLTVSYVNTVPCECLAELQQSEE